MDPKSLIFEKVKFIDKTDINYSLHTVGEKNKYSKILIAEFSGTYKSGSAGASDAKFIKGITKTAKDVWDCFGIIIDFSDLYYDWGDEMDCFLPFDENFALVVSDKCESGIATLLFGLNTNKKAIETDFIFSNTNDAQNYVIEKLKSKGFW